MKKNEIEEKIYRQMIANKGVFDEDLYLMTYELMKNDEENTDKIKVLMQNKLLKQIQAIFNRLSPEGNLEQQSIEDWLCYIYDLRK